MRTKVTVILVSVGALCLALARDAQAWRGFGGFHAGGFGGFHASSFHSGGFGGGFGSVHHSSFSHYGPATGFTHTSGTTHVGYGGAEHTSSATHVGSGGAEHYSGATHVGYGGAEHYSGWGGYHSDSGAWGGYHAAATYHPVNYGSVYHYNPVYHVPGAYGGWGHAAVYHGPAGGTAVAYHGPVASGVAVRGPAGYGAAVVHGPAGGTVAAYHGPFSAGAVATLPAGYTTVAWHGDTYYHSDYTFYHPYWYGGTVAYVPIYPPLGFYFASLPSDATQTVINNNTYYVSGGVYYQPGSQDGQQGYTVVAAPVQAGGPQALPSPTGGGPDPFQLLNKMSDYLGGEKHIIMEVGETFDEVTTAGQKIQLSSERKIWLERPDKLAVKVSGGGTQRRIAYDGNTFTIIDLFRNIYASVPVQGSLDSALDQMGKQYGMAQPGDDLLYSNLYAALSGQIESGQYLGQERVLNKKCEHLAFTQFGVNWEIWVEKGEKPIPRKLLITYVGTPGRPQYSLLVTGWETPILMRGADYRPNPPSGATSTSMLTLTGQAAGGQ